MATIQLRHSTHRLPKRVEYFYDGLTVAEDGVVSIDSSEREHIRAAYFRGYQDTFDGRRLYGFSELDEYVAEMTAKSAEEEEHESSIDGRQSTTEHRVRSRK